METESYFNALRATKESIEAVRKAFEPELAFDFNTFDFFYPNENKTSEILAYFLNPKGKHGQGKSFFDIFFANIEDRGNETFTGRLDIVDTAKDKKVEIICEKATNENRRIDICIEIGNREYIIGIENKIYSNTTDQYEQILHYNDYLSKSVTDSSKYLLIYLSPKGKEIEGHSMPKEMQKKLIASNKLLLINYEDHIIPIIRIWHQQCRAVRVKSFLQDLEQFFKNQYTGEKFMESNEKLIEQALMPENAEITLSLIKYKEDIYYSLLKTLKNQLIDACKNKYTVIWDINRDIVENTLEISSVHSIENDYKITFEFKRKYNQSLDFGITRTQDKSEKGEILKKLFDKKYSVNNTSDSWLCWAPFNHHNWNEESFVLIASKKQDMKTEIMKTVEEVMDLIIEAQTQ